MTAVRKWYIARALESFPALATVINELTEDEVLAALKLEAASTRRKSIIDRLVSRAIRLREVSYAAQLKEKFCGTHPLEDHDRR